MNSKRLINITRQLRVAVQEGKLTGGSFAHALGEIDAIAADIAEFERAAVPLHLQAPHDASGALVVCDGKKIVSLFSRRPVSGTVS